MREQTTVVENGWNIVIMLSYIAGIGSSSHEDRIGQQTVSSRTTYHRSDKLCLS